MTRLFWIVGGSIVTVAALAFGSAQVVDALAHEETVEERTFDAAGITTLDVDADNGTVEVLGRDVDEITVRAEISRGLRPTRHRVEVAGDRLEVRASCPSPGIWCRVDYSIVVPAEVFVVADTGNGRLVVRDVEGDVVADGHNGRIELTRLSGRVEASTRNGSLVATGLRSDAVVARSHNGRVEVEFAEPPGSVQARTSNGSVLVVVPETDDEYRVELDTDRGSTDVGVRTDPTSDRSIVARTSNGDAAVRYPTG